MRKFRAEAICTKLNIQILEEGRVIFAPGSENSGIFGEKRLIRVEFGIRFDFTCLPHMGHLATHMYGLLGLHSGLSFHGVDCIKCIP